MKYNHKHGCFGWLASILTFAVLIGAPTASALSTQVFFDDFDGNITFDAGAGGFVEGLSITDSQGLDGLGNPGNEFSGNISRNSMFDTVSITLTDLPQHDRISIGFLFAALDTWDGDDVFPGGASPDLFNVTVDGVSIFSESFRNLSRDDDPFCNAGDVCQSYVAPIGGQIATGGTDLFGNIGFSGGRDGAYDMYLEAAFQDIAHTSDTAVITFFASGSGNQSLSDESFGLDNISVSVSQVPVPPALWLLGSSLLGLIGMRRGIG